MTRSPSRLPCSLWAERRILTAQLLGGFVALFDRQILAQHAFQIAGVPGRDQQIPRADAQVQIARLLDGKINPQVFRTLFCTHDGFPIGLVFSFRESGEPSRVSGRVLRQFGSTLEFGIGLPARLGS